MKLLRYLFLLLIMCLQPVQAAWIDYKWLLEIVTYIDGTMKSENATIFMSEIDCEKMKIARLAKHQAYLCRHFVKGEYEDGICSNAKNNSTYSVYAACTQIPPVPLYLQFTYP